MSTTPGHIESRIDMDISLSEGLHQNTCLATPVHILPALYSAFECHCMLGDAATEFNRLHVQVLLGTAYKGSMMCIQ